MWWTKTARSALLLAASAAALAGCAGGQTGPHGATPQVADAPTPLDQYAITVAPHPEELALAPHGYDLSPAQKDALAVFASRWRETGTEIITVQSPTSASGCRCDPRATARAAMDMLVGLGVPATVIRLADYDGGGRPDAPVVARYLRNVASTADCSTHWSNLSSTYDNAAGAHYGCAQTQNIAAMVADPRDFTRPSPSTPADATRRSFVLDKYRQGQLTASLREDQALGTVSQAVH